MKYLYKILIAISFSFTSCSISAIYIESGASKMPATSSSEVKIYAGDIDQEYQVIGSITIETPGNANDAKRYLQKRAALIGADAVIFAEINKMNTYALSTGMSGVAVKLK